MRGQDSHCWTVMVPLSPGPGRWSHAQGWAVRAGDNEGVTMHRRGLKLVTLSSLGLEGTGASSLSQAGHH